MRIALLLGTCLALSAGNATADIAFALGDAPGFWKTHSVVFGEVVSVERLGENPKNPLFPEVAHRVSVRPLGTLSGPFDPGLHRELDLNIQVGGRSSTIRNPPRPKQKILFVLWNDDGTLRVPSSTFFQFMPQAAAVAVVFGFDDPEVEKTLSTIQRIRARKAPLVMGSKVDFWKTHSVVFGEILFAKRLGEEQFFQGTHRITLRPEATLAGPFDPGLHRELDIDIVAGVRMAAIVAPPRPNQEVVCVLWNDDGVFRIPFSHFAFMPNGVSLFPVIGLADPRVERALSAIQKLRRPRQPPKNAPVEGTPPSP